MVAHAARRAQRTLQQLAGATLSQVEVVADDRALMAAVDPDTIAIVDIALAQAHPGLHERPARAWPHRPKVCRMKRVWKLGNA